MKIALFGATGRVGQYALKKALSEGHSVTALTLNKKNLSPSENLTIIEGDVRNRQDVEKTISGADAVLSTLGTNKTTALTEAIPLIAHAMKENDIERIVTIGTAGILESRVEPGKLRYQDKDSRRVETFDVEEHHKVFDMLSASTLEWTIICPTYLPDGDAKGNYRVEKDFIPDNAQQITVGDTADFALSELLACDFVGSRVGITY